jgi:hypothetical protein
MSGGQKGFTPVLDLARISAVGAEVRKATRAFRIVKRPKKPTKVAAAFLASSKNRVEDRKSFGKLLEVTFYGPGDRYAIRNVGDGYEIWDAETHDVYGPYRTYDDAHQAVRRL